MAQPKQLLMRALAAAALAVTGVVSISAASAQTEQSTPAPSQQAPNIPEQKLDAIAAALEQVVSVRENYEQRLQKAPASDADKIADEAKNALVKAVTDQGLSVEEYNSILVVAQNNPEVRKKIIQRMRPPAK
jgi:curli biogenesis system outer membrane secretion channel CsgG